MCSVCGSSTITKNVISKVLTIRRFFSGETLKTQIIEQLGSSLDYEVQV